MPEISFLGFWFFSIQFQLSDLKVEVANPPFDFECTPKVSRNHVATKLLHGHYSLSVNQCEDHRKFHWFLIWILVFCMANAPQTAIATDIVRISISLLTVQMLLTFAPFAIIMLLSMISLAPLIGMVRLHLTQWARNPLRNQSLWRRKLKSTGRSIGLVFMSLKVQVFIQLSWNKFPFAWNNISSLIPYRPNRQRW